VRNEVILDDQRGEYIPTAPKYPNTKTLPKINHRKEKKGEDRSVRLTAFFYLGNITYKLVLI